MGLENQIYFDIAATTPLDKDVAKLMHTLNTEYYGNPSSIHKIGQKSHNVIEKSRLSIAEKLNCKSSEIYFTSGGSESNNLALRGLLNKGDHLITSSYEHPSILNLASELEKNGIEVSYIKPNNNGEIQLSDIKPEIKKNTKLISIMYVNNELGVINPIKDISDFAKSKNILFHTDAVQFIGKEKFDLKSYNIDLLSMGAHKFYGPKGIGLLYIKQGLIINPIITGGGQESGLRAGTENISHIAGMDLALNKAYNNLDRNKNKIINLEKHFINKLNHYNIDYRLNGEKRIPGILNLTFKNVDGNTLLIHLDMIGFAISYGSACSSGTASPPLTLLEMGMPKDEAKCTVRISIGKFIKESDIDMLCSKIHHIISTIKK
ncbi:MAG: cysteine desulfurase NifS [Candidatus Marinimicrobia bacterium]|nr:cysteine desulfurase NifS [Candidatus Neomarinimicrobiota bacterium]|tara:strand:- start:15870 stop:17000 length:1131 start_codon:yes stop_codon:yes gene_type:complete